MLNYTQKEIKHIITSILDREDIIINPCGNHHLNRHLVYEVIIDTRKTYIFKLYYKKDRRNKEIRGLSLLKYKINVPYICQYGELPDGFEWLLTYYVEGVLLDSVLELLPNDNKVLLFHEMGEILGKMHQLTIRQSISYLNVFQDKLDHVKKVILETELKEQPILLETMKWIEKNSHIFSCKLKEAYVHHDFDGRNILVNQEKGIFHLNGIIDFEGSSIDILERDIIGLYYRYFIDHKNLEEAFFQGYQSYIKIDDGFYDRLPIHLCYDALSNCSWAYLQAPEYYQENISFLKKMKVIYK